MEITAAAAWLNESFASFDAAITVFVHNLYLLGGDFFTPFFNFISFFGKGGIMLIIAGLILALYKPTRRYGTAMLIGLAIGALITNGILKIIIARPRPYMHEESVFYQFWLLVGQKVESDLSFPSGHATAAFAAMVPLFILCDKKVSWLALLFAVLMGISRIYLCVHYPTDVIGGLIVGTFSGIVAVPIADKFPQKWYEHEIIKKKEGRH